MDGVNNEMLRRLNDTNLESFSSTAGTAYKSVRRSASVKDKSAFFDYLLESGEWQLVDLKANAPAVEAFADEHESFPPGVNLNRMTVVNVRTK